MPLHPTNLPIGYLHLETLTQCTEREIREAHPNTSFAEPFQAPGGYAWVFPAPSPTHDPITHTVREIAPVETIKGHWEQQWETVALSPEQVAANQEAKRLAAIPVSVSPRQIRQALSRAGLRTAVESAVAAGDQDTKDWWEFATEFERTHPMVVGMGAALGQTALQLDSLFTLAATL